MPYAEFQPGNAGLALPNFQLQSAEAASSLMERAQRRRIAEQDAMMRQQKHAADMATTDLNQQSLRAEIGMQQIRFKDAERVARQAADTRDEYNRVAPNIDESLKYIQGLTDPFEQRRLMAQLQMSAARFHKDPQVAAMLEKQTSATMSLIDANEKTKLQDYISTTQFAATEADAKAKFPGQELRLTIRPNSTPGQPPMSYYTPTGRPDPQLEAQAMSLLNLARATGDLGKIDAVLQHPAVQQITLVPGNNFTKEYGKAFQETVELGRKREKEKRDAEDQRMQQQRFDDEQRALTVPGFFGKARSGVVAAKMADESAAAETSMGLIFKLEDITKTIADKPSRIADPALAGEAEVIAKLIQSTNRISIVGPGAVTPEEWKMLEKFAANPTDAKTLIPFFRERAKQGYQTSRDALFNKMATSARQNGIDVDPRYWTRESITSRRVSPDGPSTGGNTVQYNGRSYTVLKPDPKNPGMLLVQDENKDVFRIPDERSRQPAPAQPNSRP